MNQHQTPFIAALILSACGTQPPAISSEEQLCRASLTGDMLNPESAEFIGFEPIDRNSMIAYISSGLMRRGVALDEAHTSAIEAVDDASGEGVVYSLIRVREPARFGGASTVRAHACAAKKGICECFPAHEE